jgi:hypothetical protein
MTPSTKVTAIEAEQILAKAGVTVEWPSNGQTPKPATDDSTFDPRALDVATLLAAGVPEPKYLLAPYLPAGVSIWAAGGSESGKSIWTLANCSELSRSGVNVVYVSQENPLTVEHRRLSQLRPDPEHFRMFHDQGFDLGIPEHVAALSELAQGARLIVLDTFTACWSGEENDTAAVVGFDRDVVRPLIRETGASILTLDHMGHPQMIRRQGVNAPRGSSAKGQKADFLLHFRAGKGSEFTIEHGKNRLGGAKEPARRYKILDTDDGGLSFAEHGVELEVDYEALRERAVDIVQANPSKYTKSSLAGAMGGRRQDNLSAIAQALEEGTIGPNVKRASLTAQESL